ncbi:hypothetical protein [Stieleria mannarensis]|uniref:hypothetical protein n=1 Tax=Stieleria mannarensis TaxID=2755585 RepID=UPI0015FFA40E|nr:hypothetical protein [Rhodopirellula sp. JC639]
MDGDQDSAATPEFASPVNVAPPGRDSFARFLYNQNPFYLISCLLVIYGCQSLAVSGGGLIDKSLSMAGGIAAYTLLMAVVCVGVVRIANVWDDARSIFLVVVISLVAVTTGFDELCIGEQPMARAFACAAAALVLLVVESVLWSCGIRLSFWYRTALYAHFAVLIGFPLLLGNAVATRNDSLANWGSVLFSAAIGASVLLLIPAVRRGQQSVRGNGTPWNWPLYPLSAFVVLVVLAGIRSHAIWMSFGFYGVAGKFEPFLLLPILAAVIVLVAEAGLGQRNQTLQGVAMVSTSGLLLCASTRGGATWLPIQSDLAYGFGSSLTVTLGMIFLVYSWMTLRGVRYASLAVATTLLVTGLAAPIPEIGQSYGLASWMFPAAACVILLVMTLRRVDADWLWAALAGMAATTIAMVGDAYGRQTDGLIAGVALATLAMLVIGATFKTPLAVFLRYLAAGVMSFAATVIVFRFLQDPRGVILYAVAGMAILSLIYAFLIRRRGWLAIAVLQAVLFCGTFSYQGHRSGKLRRINWPIASGLMCLCVGVAITTGKTGLYRRLAERNGDGRPSRFEGGL